MRAIPSSCPWRKSSQCPLSVEGWVGDLDARHAGRDADELVAVRREERGHYGVSRSLILAWHMAQLCRSGEAFQGLGCHSNRGFAACPEPLLASWHSSSAL